MTELERLRSEVVTLKRERAAVDLLVREQAALIETAKRMLEADGRFLANLTESLEEVTRSG